MSKLQVEDQDLGGASVDFRDFDNKPFPKLMDTEFASREPCMLH